MGILSTYNLVNGNPRLENTAIKSINRLLKEEKLCCITTIKANSLPYIHTAYYACDFDSGRLYFISELKSIHAKNLSVCDDVAVAVFRQTEIWGDAICGAQIEGKVRVINEIRPNAILKLYADKFPTSEMYIKDGLVGDFSGSRFFEITIETIKVIDGGAMGDDEYVILARPGEPLRN